MAEPTPRVAALLADIQEFCDRHQMSKTRFGELALNDKPFVGQVEGGRRVWPETEDKVRGFMEKYAPPAAAAEEAAAA